MPISINRKNSGRRAAGTATNEFRSVVAASCNNTAAEYEAELAALTADYRKEFKPDRAVECVLVDCLAHCEWRRRRLGERETRVWNLALQYLEAHNQEANLGTAFMLASKEFAQIDSWVRSTEATYKSTLKQLKRLQSEPKCPAPELASQTPGPWII